MGDQQPDADAFGTGGDEVNCCNLAPRLGNLPFQQLLGGCGGGRLRHVAAKADLQWLAHLVISCGFVVSASCSGLTGQGSA